MGDTIAIGGWSRSGRRLALLADQARDTAYAEASRVDVVRRLGLLVKQARATGITVRLCRVWSSIAWAGDGDVRGPLLRINGGKAASGRHASLTLRALI